MGRWGKVEEMGESIDNGGRNSKKELKQGLSSFKPNASWTSLSLSDSVH